MEWRVRNQNGRSELVHYGVKGMKWGVRKDKIVSGAKNLAIKAFETKPGKFLKSNVYKMFDVKDFDGLVDRLKGMLKTPKGIAAIAAIVILPEPLIWAGTAAFASLKASGVLSMIIH